MLIPLCLLLCKTLAFNSKKRNRPRIRNTMGLQCLSVKLTHTHTHTHQHTRGEGDEERCHFLGASDTKDLSPRSFELAHTHTHARAPLSSHTHTHTHKPTHTHTYTHRQKRA